MGLLILRLELFLPYSALLLHSWGRGTSLRGSVYSGTPSRCRKRRKHQTGGEKDLSLIPNHSLLGWQFPYFCKEWVAINDSTFSPMCLFLECASSVILKDNPNTRDREGMPTTPTKGVHDKFNSIYGLSDPM